MKNVAEIFLCPQFEPQPNNWQIPTDVHLHGHLKQGFPTSHCEAHPFQEDLQPHESWWAEFDYLNGSSILGEKGWGLDGIGNDEVAGSGILWES